MFWRNVLFGGQIVLYAARVSLGSYFVWRHLLACVASPSALARKLADKLDLTFLTNRKEEQTVLTSEVKP